MSSKRNIQQRGNSFVVAVSRNGKRERVTCNTMDEALRVRAELEQSLGSSLRPFSKPWTLEEGVTQCTNIIWKGTRNEKKAIANAKCAIAFFGKDTLLDSIDTAWADSYVASLKAAGNIQSTVNRKLAALSRVMTLARESEKMSRTPKLRRKKETGGRIRFVIDAEEQQLLDAFSAKGKDCHKEAAITLADTGLRTGELWKIEARDIDTRLGLIAVWVNKADKPRSIPMTERVREIIERRMSIHPTGPLFPHNNAWMNHGWDQAKLAMNLQGDKQFVPHVLRHTCASRLLQGGASLVAVQEWMGHKTVEVTRKYGHLRPEDLLAAKRILER